MKILITVVKIKSWKSSITSYYNKFIDSQKKNYNKFINYFCKVYFNYYYLEYFNLSFISSIILFKNSSQFWQYTGICNSLRKFLLCLLHYSIKNSTHQYNHLKKKKIVFTPYASFPLSHI